MSGTINPALLTKQEGEDVPTRNAARYPARFVNGVFQGHDISVQLRLSGSFGGVDDGEVITTTVLNDTGASIGSMFRSYWQRLNVYNIPIQQYTPTILADGTTQNRETVTFEMRLIGYASDGSIFSISSWMADTAVLVDDPQPDQEYPSLSGNAMRGAMFFLTSPRDGNKFLYVARTKEAMVEVLNSL
jgi:hypothetical protein